MSSTIDAAIIKALVEHVGGDSSHIPDGAIGGKTYTEGDGINIVNDQISVEYDANTMELKEGKLAAKTQITVGDGLTTSNGKLIANLDMNTMQMNSGKISAKTQLSAGTGISIASGKVNVNYDTDTMEIKDGKLAAKGGDTNFTTTVQRLNVKYDTDSLIGGIDIPAETSLDIPLGSFLVINNGTKKKYVVVALLIDSNGNSNYRLQGVHGDTWKSMVYMPEYQKYNIVGLRHGLGFTDEYGLFIRGTNTSNATEVITIDEFNAFLHYFNSQLSTNT